jgi:hypothetical protein
MPALNCLDWSTPTAAFAFNYGAVGVPNTGWTDVGTTGCGQKGHLYCFQQ